MKLTAVRDTSEDIGIPNFEQLFHAQIEVNWGYEVSVTGAWIWLECTALQ